MKYLSFDLEIAKLIPFNQDLDAHRPLGITCAAAWASDAETPMVWCARGQHGEISSAMNVDQVHAMLAYLQQMVHEGYTLLTFNGAGFDFKTIAEFGNLELCKTLALSHVDIFFHVFCLKGFSPGLNTCAKGMGLAGKTEGMDGALAPEMWNRGDYGKVLQYVAQDVRTTLDLAMAIENAGGLTWTSKSGNTMRLPIGRLLSVVEALELPEPDTSWMKDAWTRDKFVGWTKA